MSGLSHNVLKMTRCIAADFNNVSLRHG